mmetsp:Transcript_15682/g.28331  ORF Transcript_15682/g.28331 Transcript_15682/m.28331 type:complete len:206 (-) Transcript_15682:808-1425(-)
MSASSKNSPMLSSSIALMHPFSSRVILCSFSDAEASLGLSGRTRAARNAPVITEDTVSWVKVLVRPFSSTTIVCASPVFAFTIRFMLGALWILQDPLVLIWFRSRKLRVACWEAPARAFGAADGVSSGVTSPASELEAKEVIELECDPGAVLNDPAADANPSFEKRMLFAAVVEELAEIQRVLVRGVEVLEEPNERLLGGPDEAA